jgi:hypothetical protein
MPSQIGLFGIGTIAEQFPQWSPMGLANFEVHSMPRHIWPMEFPVEKK